MLYFAVYFYMALDCYFNNPLQWIDKLTSLIKSSNSTKLLINEVGIPSLSITPFAFVKARPRFSNSANKEIRTVILGYMYNTIQYHYIKRKEQLNDMVIGMITILIIFTVTAIIIKHTSQNLWHIFNLLMIFQLLCDGRNFFKTKRYKIVS